MLETKIIENPAIATEQKREEILTKIRDLSSDEDFQVEGRAWLKEQFDSRAYSPLTSRGELDSLLVENPKMAELFDLVRQLSGKDEFREVPARDEFVVIDEPYTGADGKERHPNPKYIPRHLSPYLKSMQEGYKKFLGSHPEYVGPNGRPGLVVLSGYRSDYYQLGVFANEVLKSGVDETLTQVALPGESQHADFENCAVDFTTIGDENGNRQKPDGTLIGFEDTVEFDWLLKHCVDYGFWFPYGPDPENPMNEIGPEGIIVEPWHLQFLGNSELAEDNMLGKRVSAGFEARARAFGRVLTAA